MLGDVLDAWSRVFAKPEVSFSQAALLYVMNFQDLDIASRFLRPGPALLVKTFELSCSGLELRAMLRAIGIASVQR